jgi:intein/homing endonuclease
MPDMAWDIEPRKDVKLFVGCPIIPSFQYIHTRVQEAWEHAWKPPQTTRVFERSFGIATARENLADKFLEGDWTHLLWLDSVPPYSPLLVRDGITKLHDVVSIGDLADFKTDSVERLEPKNKNLEVLHSSGSWSKIKNVIRHPYKGKIIVFTTPEGILHITPNHSIYAFNRLTDAGLLKVGDFIHPCDYYVKGQFSQEKGSYFYGTEKVADLFGFFAAEGSVSGYVVKIDNTDYSVLKYYQEIFEEHFNVRTSWVCQKRKNESRKDLYTFEVSNKELAKLMLSKFYTFLKYKRVPFEILNAPQNIKVAFMKGYIEGDGHTRKLDVGNAYNLTTNSQVLALGLKYILNSLGKMFTFQSRMDKPLISQITVNAKLDTSWIEKWEEALRLRKENGWGHHKIAKALNISKATVANWIYMHRTPGKSSPREIKKIFEYDYDGFVYDISTENEQFCTGSGLFLVHNSDILLKPDTIKRMIEVDKPVCAGLYYETSDRRQPEAFHHSQVPFRRDAPIDFKKNEYFEFPDESEDFYLGGLGLVMFKREVFDKIDKPYFLYSSEYESKLKDDFWAISEDFWVLLKLQKAGIKITYVPDILAGHCGNCVVWGPSQINFL